MLGGRGSGPKRPRISVCDVVTTAAQTARGVGASNGARSRPARSDRPPGSVLLDYCCSLLDYCWLELGRCAGDACPPLRVRLPGQRVRAPVVLLGTHG